MGCDAFRRSAFDVVPDESRADVQIVRLWPSIRLISADGNDPDIFSLLQQRQGIKGGALLASRVSLQATNTRRAAAEAKPSLGTSNTGRPRP